MTSIENSSMNYWLTTDLDGTLIPIAHDRERHEDALRQIRKWVESGSNREIVFVTGRHLESVLQVAEAVSLPLPHSIFADVGTSLWRKKSGTTSWHDPSSWTRETAYDALLNSVTGGMSTADLQSYFEGFEQLELQPPEQQGKFKLSYDCKAENMNALVKRMEAALQEASLPFTIISSVDPFNGKGLIDMLPSEVSKLSAITWFIKQYASAGNHTWVFAGDSGNDLQVFLSDIPSIVVSNTPDAVRAVVQSHFGPSDVGKTVFFSNEASSSGVLDGIKHFRWLQS